MTTGLFIGRFQPFHNAHLIDIKNALKEVDKLLILIGSAQYSHTKDNPFSVNERKTMIKAVLKASDTKNCKIFTLADINDDSKWVDYVKMNLPKFDVVFSGNLRVIRLFKEKNFPIKKIKLIKNINGTKIREKILKDKNWQDDVPKVIVRFIEGVDGVKRIREYEPQTTNHKRY